MELIKKIIYLLCLILMLTACSKELSNDLGQKKIENDETINWKTVGLASPGIIIDEQSFWIDNYMTISHDYSNICRQGEIEYQVYELGIYDGTIYRGHLLIENYQLPDFRVVLGMINADDSSAKMTEISREQLNSKGCFV